MVAIFKSRRAGAGGLMMNISTLSESRRRIFIVILVALVLTLSSFLFVTTVVVAQTPPPSTPWTGVDGAFPSNWDYSNQTQINSGNVQNLQVSWVVPIPNAPAPYSADDDEGVIITPIVVSGIAYMVTNYHLLLALDAASGKIIWQQELPLLSFASVDPYSNLTGHYHAIWYTPSVRGVPLIWVYANNYSIFAFNALNGDLNLEFPVINWATPVPGNFGYYGTITPTLDIDNNRGVLIAGMAVNEGDSAGRGFYQAFNITTTPPTPMWRDYTMPPQDGSDPTWSLSSVNNMTYAYIFNGTGAVNLKNLSPAQLNATLYDDWGNAGFNGTNSFAGNGPAWGGTWALDESTGVAYVADAQAAPDFNATDRPGPDLWADSILAINVTNGNIIWGFQTNPHDLWDWDCSWSVILGNVTIGGQTQQAVFKGCKDGYEYALNAQTGALLWAVSPASIQRTATAMINNPLNATDMTKPDMCYPATSCVFNPWGGGGLESDPAFDPVSQQIFVAAYNNPGNISIEDVGVNAPLGSLGANGYGGNFNEANTTIWAYNAATGAADWSYFIPNTGFRGGISVTDGMVVVPAANGNMYFLNTTNGNLIYTKFVGAAMITEPAIAQDPNGNTQIILPAGTASVSAPGAAVLGVGGLSAGFVVAFSVPSSSSSSSTSSAPPTTVISTIGSTATTVITSTVSGPSTTTGVSSGAFYAVVAVAVILLIATAFLAIRRRPSSASSTASNAAQSST
jgi:hypothetical protein